MKASVEVITKHPDSVMPVINQLRADGYRIYAKVAGGFYHYRAVAPRNAHANAA